uniref:Eukaryotic translation initiation factor 5 n=1 Tax=Heterorhabditis bacteriophora TaxID=37862 RepID=A0A1I7XFG9_HETBA
MALNVNRAVTDPFYRYKMPKLLAKVEGKGNGIKTVVANMSDIAKALERPPMCKFLAFNIKDLNPTKYFGCELGAQTKFDDKNHRYIVNGEHDAEKLQDILDGFIKKFVLCPACDNPETALSVRKSQIHSKCKACGHTFIIDNKLKLSTFILKHPPKIEVDFSKAKENGNGHASKVEDTHVAADLNGDRSSNDDEDDWAPDPVEDEGKLASGIGKLVLDKDLEKSVEDRLDMLHRFFINAKQENRIGDGKEIANEAERLELKQKAPLLLADVLLDENIIKDSQLKTYRRALLRFTLGDKKAQRYLMGGIEQLINRHEDVLLAKAAHIIKALYDTDIVEEESLLSWGEKPSSKYVSKTQANKIIEKCEPVLTWLREAEEEDDEEEGSDDEIKFDDRNTKTSQYVEKAKTAVKEEIKIQGDDGEEIDIDDI